ncbi:hypothetical protein LCGC14_1963940 [marine sediment metagenome]|uniref:Uncharacterized protein n=1 Tax=marine sediment metagenome TaxID=412755 RepID=A0A0F9IAR9_9ZZZZ
MTEEWSADQIYGIMEGGSTGIMKINNITFVDKKEIIAEFLEDLRDVFKIGSYHRPVHDGILEKIKKWEKRRESCLK